MFWESQCPLLEHISDKRFNTCNLFPEKLMEEVEGTLLEGHFLREVTAPMSANSPTVWPLLSREQKFWALHLPSISVLLWLDMNFFTGQGF